MFSERAFDTICMLGNEDEIKTSALLDTGSSGHAFIDEEFAREVCEKLDISPQELVRAKPIRGYDGKAGAAITHAIYPTMTVNGHRENLTPLLITKLGNHKLILGRPWMKRHGLILDMANDSFTFWPDHCDHPGAWRQKNRNSTNVVRDKNAAAPPMRHKVGAKVETSPEKTSSAGPSIDILKRKTTSPPSVEDEEKEVKATPRVEKDVVRTPRVQSTKKVKRTPRDSRPRECLAPPDMAFVGAAAYNFLSKQKDVELFAISLRDIDDQIQKDTDTPTDPKTVLPEEFHDLIDVFSKLASDELAPHREHDHKIVIEGNQKLGHSPLRGMSSRELDFVKKYLEDNLKKGFIVASHAPCSSPILLAKKPSGGLRFCVDYRRLNQMTKKDRYPIPLITETLAQLSKAKIFSKIDIRQAFHKLRMEEASEDLTTFTTRFGAYKWRVLPFGLTGGPSTWQHYINDVLWKFLNDFCTAYLDDILIYSKNRKEHSTHVRKVLERLRAAGLQADIDKCEFFVTETKYLGLIISVDGIRMDPAKIKAIMEWNTPTNLKHVRSFIGFCNFYRRFIKSFSKIAKPLNALAKKNTVFAWDSACDVAFRELKSRVLEAPILCHFDREKQCYLETDSSDTVNGGVLSQKQDDGLLHPIAFFSKNMSPAECNYEIYDKELLAIIRCFEQWRPELEATDLPVKIFTDHKSLEYFMTTKKLTRRQVRWSEFLSQYNFVILYQSGAQNVKADALTRRPNDQSSEEIEDRLEHQTRTLLTPDRLEAQPIDTERENEEISEELTLAEKVSRANEQDETCSRIRRRLEAPDSAPPEDEENLPNHKNCSVKEGLLYKEDRLWVPDLDHLRLDVIRQVHDQIAVGHPGYARTFRLINQCYYWPRMDRTIKRYVQNCHPCRRAKAPRDKYNGKLNPLPIPKRNWEDITLDFVVGLPRCSDRYNAILMVIDRLSKERHYIPCDTENDGTSAEATAKMLIQHVWKLHGLPLTIVSDRGPQFISIVWKTLCKILGIVSKLSTAFHPETDGQSEIANQEMERHLRTFCNHHQDDWSEVLPMAEFAANECHSASTGVSPFMATRGFNPRMSFDVVDLSAHTTRERILKRKAADISEEMEEIRKFVTENMKDAQEKQMNNANIHRKDIKYEVGDLVWVSTKNIITNRPSKKLDHKMIGPYPIIKVVGSSYQVQLPESVRIFDTFHPSLLRKASEDPLPGQINEPAPPVVIDDEEEWEVDDILDARKHYRRVQFLVKWKGHDEDRNWYNSEGFRNATEIVKDFYEKYPDKPRPDWLEQQSNQEI